MDREISGLVFALIALVVGAMLYLWFGDSIRESLAKGETNDMHRYEEDEDFADVADNWDLVENGIHVGTGMKDDPNLPIVIARCTSCHSPKLITQNRASREGWESMIRWMQQTQGLPDLAEQEPIILDYLAKHYAPQETGRRPALDTEAIEWYVLALEDQ